MTWRKIGGPPITKTLAPGGRSASTNWIAEPTLTISSTAAVQPIDHSFCTYSSGEWPPSLVTNASRRPLARIAATASGARGVAAPPTQTVPSRSRITWS